MSKVENVFLKNSFFIYVCIFIVALSAAVILIIDSQLKEQIIEEYTHDIDNELVERANYINNSVRDARNSLDFFYSTPPISGIVRATQNNKIDPLNGDTLAVWYRRLETIFEAYLENSQTIKQVRLIRYDEQGSELVRVEKVKDNIRIVDKTRLQTKGSREYFKEIKQLNLGQTYVSTINLNREWGEIEHPHKPTFRVARNIYDDEKNPFGFIIINIDASFLLNKITDNIPDGLALYLLNNSDGIILSPEEEQAFQFEFYPDKKWTFEEEYSGTGSFSSLTHSLTKSDVLHDFYFSEKHLRISPSDRNNTLRLIVGFDIDSFNSDIFARRATSIFTIFAVVVLVVIIMFFYQRWLNHRLSTSKKEAQLAAIIDDSTDAIVGTDLDGNIQSWNSSAETIFGYSARKAIGKNLYTLLEFEISSEFISRISERIIARESIPAFDVDVKNDHQSHLTVSITLSPIVLKENNKIEGIAAIIRDVTEKKVIEKQILNLNANLEKQVAERTQELEKAHAKALEASQVKSDFIANVSHEIRTPMNGVVGMLHLINKEPLSEQQLKYLNMAENSANALTVLINDILDLSKIEAGKLEVDTTDVDIIRLIGDTCSSLALNANNKGVPIICDLSDVVHPIVHTDGHRIRQILINLINNAIKFTNQGKIVVSARSEEASDGSVKIYVSVKDTGVGIAEDKINHLFESFSQEESGTSRKFGGTGLGLAISKKLCQLLNGDINVTSEKGVGSEFTFHLSAKSLETPSIFQEEENENIAFYVVSRDSDLLNSVKKSTSNISKRVKVSAEFQKSWQDEINLRESENKESVIIATEHNTINSTLLTGKNTSFVAILNDVQQSAAHPWKSITTPFTPYTLYSAFGLSSIGEKYSVRAANINKLDQALLPQFTEHRGKRVLLVDDNDINLEVGTGIIEDFGIEVDTASNGEIAIQKLALSEYALVFMDCQMPVMDGFTTTQNIRANTSGNFDSAIPIIAMTANAMSGSRDECLQSGMNDYITKPVDADELGEKMLYWLNMGNKDIAAPFKNTNVVAIPTEKNLKSNSNEALVWDEITALERLKHRDDRLCKLINMFVNSTPERLERLEKFTEQRDFVNAYEAAHEIKGTAANLACDRVYEHCCKIEEFAKQEELAQLSQEVNKVLETYQLTKGALTQFRDAKSS